MTPVAKVDPEGKAVAKLAEPAAGPAPPTAPAEPASVEKSNETEKTEKTESKEEASSNKCIASSNKCLTSSNKKLLVTGSWVRSYRWRQVGWTVLCPVRSFLLLVASLLLVVRPGAPSCVLAPSSDALCS